jgi:DNA-binding LacI/PurR family transcriptional regulator
LIELGHQVIAHIGGSFSDAASYSPTPSRRLGWEQTLAQAGLASEALDVESQFTAVDGHRVTVELLKRRPDVTAIFASSDEIAMGAMQAIRELGLEIGKDISIIGIDGHELGEAMGLTTIAQPAYEQGARAASLLLGALDNPVSLPGGSETIFETRLIERASTGIPKFPG